MWVSRRFVVGSLSSRREDAGAYRVGCAVENEAMDAKSARSGDRMPGITAGCRGPTRLKASSGSESGSASASIRRPVYPAGGLDGCSVDLKSLVAGAHVVLDSDGDSDSDPDRFKPNAASQARRRRAGLSSVLVLVHVLVHGHFLVNFQPLVVQFHRCVSSVRVRVRVPLR